MSNKVTFNPGQRANLYRFNLTENPDGVRIDEDFNIRKDYGDLEELKKSLIENGQKVPAQGRRMTDPDTGEKYYLLSDGHRRLKAAKMAVAEGHQVHFLLTTEAAKYSETDRYLDMFIRNSGKSLTPMEEANLFVKLQEKGFTVDGISKQIGKTKVHIYNMLKLLNTATEGTQKLVEEGKVSATTVVNMLQDTAPEVIEANINKAIAENPTKKKVTPKHIAEAKTGRERKTNTAVKPLPKNYVDLADREPVADVPSNAAITVDVREILDAMGKEIADGAKANKHAEHYLKLIASYGKKEITLADLISSFTYREVAPV